MKNQKIESQVLIILCILVCIATTVLILSATALAADSDSGLAVTDNIGRNLPSVDLPQVNGPLYLDCSIAKTRFYIGEQIPLTITLYISDLVVSNVDEPVLNQPEFLLDKLRDPIQKQLRINGRPYQVIEFSYLFTPLKTGSFILGPFKQTCYLATAGYTKRRTMELTSRQFPVKVLAIPATGKPDYFSGAVGRFQMEVSAGSGKVLQGDPLTIKLTIFGYGNLQAVSAPLLQNSSGLKTYNTLKRTDLSTNNGSWSRITFEQNVIPTDTNLKQIGPYVFSFFDPGAGKYRLLTASVPVSVKTNPKFQVNQIVTTQTTLPSIAPLKKDPGGLRLKGWQLLGQLRFWLWQLLPLLLLSGVLIYSRRRRMIQSDSPKARAIRSINLARQQLAAARTIFNEKRYDDLLDELHHILREYLGERFNLPAAGMTGSVVGVLSEKGLPPKILANISLFFEKYDLHRFAKTNFNQDEALQLWEEFDRIISDLNKINGDKSTLPAESTVDGKER